MGINNFGDMTRLTNMVRPDIMALTKIGYAHLDNLGDLEGVLKAKTEVYPLMDATNGIAILNGDDERLRGYDPGMRRITYGFDRGNDYYAENIRVSGTDRVDCDIVHAGERFSITIPSYGAHLTMAALVATVVGHLMGLSNADITRGILSYAPVGGRANVSDTGYITLINDCYNANPNSVRAALESLSTLKGRRVAILGDMLDLAECSDEKHREMGICARHCGVDRLICSGEQAKLIIEGYLSAGGTDARHYNSTAGIIAELPAMIQKDDNVLVKASRSMKFPIIVEKLSELGNCLEQ
jgi:UDP-N-acetylmuramoyl-tripeptide--D-alanyl-D-alanine ligase